MNFYDELLTDKPEDKTYPEITAPGLLNAIVKEIWDKEHVGMIKVEYMMGEKDKKTSDWVRVMSGYCGNGFGNYWLPEIGTEVLVGFIHGNMQMKRTKPRPLSPKAAIKSHLPRHRIKQRLRSIHPKGWKSCWMMRKKPFSCRTKARRTASPWTARTAQSP